MTSVTELDVLLAGKAQIEREYTDKGYIMDAETEYSIDSKKRLNNLIEDHKPIAVCAIGGVEHALFVLTGTLVSNSLREGYSHIGVKFYEDEEDPEYNPVIPETKLNRLKNEQHRLYAKTLLRLNKLAAAEGFASGIEEPNVTMPPQKSKPIVLALYDKAIEQARQEIAQV